MITTSSNSHQGFEILNYLTHLIFFFDTPELLFEDIQFFYKGDKLKLNKILEEGKVYKNEHDITDNDIEYMSWDLEK